MFTADTSAAAVLTVVGIYWTVHALCRTISGKEPGAHSMHVVEPALGACFLRRTGGTASWMTRSGTYRQGKVCMMFCSSRPEMCRSAFGACSQAYTWRMLACVTHRRHRVVEDSFWNLPARQDLHDVFALLVLKCAERIRCM